MLESVVLFGHVSVALLIVVVVLLQRGQGAAAGTGFGAGASSTVFGARGSANFFTRSTAVLAVVFFTTSLTLAYFAQQQAGTSPEAEGSVLEGEAPENPGPGVEPAEPPEQQRQPDSGAGEFPEVPGQPSGEPQQGEAPNN